MTRILSWSEAEKLVRESQSKGGKVVSTNGCFDLLHRGHVSYLEAARQLGDLLIVAINSDASVKRNKGPSRPLQHQEDRAFVLSALRCIDAVCVFDEDTPIEWLKTIRPNIHVKGADWANKPVPEEAVLKSFGAKLSFISYVSGFSTTELIAKSQGLR